MTESKSELNSKSLCVSHIKDVDGCACAALIKHVTNSGILLANYGNINECLRRIYKTYNIVYVCDIGINETTIKEFSRILDFAELIYIDHHPIDTQVLELIQQMGVKVVHNKLDCAGILTYNMFQADLPREAGLLAAYAAVADRLENGPLAKKILSRFDRDFVLFETMLLSYALEKADAECKRKSLVPRLSRLEYPHQITNLPSLALEQAESVATLRSELSSRAKRMGDVFYADAKGASTGTIANLLIEICAADIGVGYDTNEETQITDLSIRGSSSLKTDLGKKVSKISKMYGGTGGGHRKASGARIPTSKLIEFISALSE